MSKINKIFYIFLYIVLITTILITIIGMIEINKKEKEIINKATSQEEITNKTYTQEELKDLIKIGDYVNGEQVMEIRNGKYYVNYSYELKDYDAYYPIENIQFYLSEEEYKSMEHKVGD